MWVKITRATIAQKEPVDVGDVLDLDDREAILLCNIDKAIPTDAKGNPLDEPVDETPPEKPRRRRRAAKA